MRIVRKKGAPMNISRRGFLTSTGAALTVRAMPQLARPGGRRILTLVYDKAAGAMRAVERIVY